MKSGGLALSDASSRRASPDGSFPLDGTVIVVFALLRHAPRRASGSHAPRRGGVRHSLQRHGRRWSAPTLEALLLRHGMVELPEASLAASPLCRWSASSHSLRDLNRALLGGLHPESRTRSWCCSFQNVCSRERIFCRATPCAAPAAQNAGLRAATAEGLRSDQRGPHLAEHSGRNALARFGHVAFEDEPARERARTRPLNAAKKHKIVPVGKASGAQGLDR